VGDQTSGRLVPLHLKPTTENTPYGKYPSQYSSLIASILVLKNRRKFILSANLSEDMVRKKSIETAVERTRNKTK